MSFILLNVLSFFPSQIYYFNLKIWRFFSPQTTYIFLLPSKALIRRPSR